MYSGKFRIFTLFFFSLQFTKSLLIVEKNSITTGNNEIYSKSETSATVIDCVPNDAEIDSRLFQSLNSYVLWPVCNHKQRAHTQEPSKYEIACIREKKTCRICTMNCVEDRLCIHEYICLAIQLTRFSYNSKCGMNFTPSSFGFID